MFRRLSLALCLALLLSGQSKRAVTLDDVAGIRPARGASIDSIHWSPDGKRFVTRSGTRIRVFDVASRKESEVCDTKTLEGSAKAVPDAAAFGWVNRRVQENNLQWFPDSKRLLLLVKGDLFAAEVDGGKSEQLTNTAVGEHDPKISPNGAKLSFQVKHDLYVMDVASKKAARITYDGTDLRRNAELDWVYPEELALSTAHWWSPDSKRIAYLQFNLSPVMVYPHGDLLKVRPIYEPERYPQAGTSNPSVRLGLVSAVGGKTKWVTLGGHADALLARVDWLPDGSAVAVHQLTRVQDRLSVLLTDGGKPRTLIDEKDPAWVNLGDDYRFLARSRRMLRGSERAGHRHLYLQSIDGGEPVTVTKGGWDVTNLACVDEVNERIFYVSTELTPLDRQLYSVKFDGSGKARVSPGAGTHAVKFSPDCSYYIDTHSSIAEPGRSTLNLAAGAEIAVLQDRAPVEFELQPTEFIAFHGKDGAKFHARLIRPAGFDPARKYPAIVQVYGGPHAQNVTNQWAGANWDQYLARRGFVIWQMDNRGTAGRGHAWETKLYRRLGRQEHEDQLEGVRYLLSLGFVDPGNVGINGWSYGGFMTLYSLFNAPETFKAGISGAPVTDWRHYDTIYTERYLGLPQQNEEGYKSSSAITYAGNLKGKLMLVHNFEDDNVLFQHTLRMMDALQRAGKQFEFMLYPQKAHGVSGAARRHMLEGMTNFFEKYLK